MTAILMALLGSGSGSVTVQVTGLSAFAAVGSVLNQGGASTSLIGVSASATTGTVVIPNEAITLAGVSAQGDVGFIASQGDVTFSTIGVSAQGDVGIVLAQSNVSLTMVGVSASGLINGVTTINTQTASVTVSGVSGQGNVGFVGSQGSLSFAVAGVSATGLSGDVTISTVANISVTTTGISASALIQSVSIGEGTSAVVTGVSASALVQPVTLSGSSVTTTTGVSASALVQPVTVRESSTIVVTGVSASALVESVNTTAGSRTTVTGVSASALVRPVTQSLGASVFVTGVQSTGAVSSVEAGPPAPLPAGTILLYDRASVDEPVPNGFTLYTEESGGTIVNYLIKGGSSVSRVTGTSANVSVGPASLSSSSAGGHDFPLSTVGSQPFPAPIVYTTGGTAGSHSHTVTVASVNTPFPTTGSNQGMSIPLVRCSSEVAQIPPKCIIFSGTSSVFPNFTRKSWSVSLGVYSASSSVNTSIPAPTNVGPSLSSITLSSTGGHSHTSPFSANAPAAGGFGPVNQPGGSQSHTHTASLSAVYVWNQFKHLLPVSSTTEQLVQPGMIVMYNGDSVPAGWNLCDGTNGTPNMVGFFLGYNNAASGSNTLVGRNTVGNTFPTATTPAPPPTAFSQSSIPISIATATWPHGHNATPANSPASRSDFSHTSNNAPHAHTVPSITASFPTAYVPAHLTLIFIQKA